MSKFRFVKIDDMDLWDSITNQSLQYSVFSNSVYLNAIGKNFCLYFVYKGQQVKAAISLILGDNENTCKLDDLCIYNSILFINNPEQKITKAHQEQFEITEFIIQRLDSIYKSFEISLSPEFVDMRPFIWHNYHSNDLKDKFKLDLRYTTYLNISEFFLKKKDEDTDIFRNLDGKRQSDIKKSIENNMTVRETDDVELFIRIYDESLKFQNQEVSKTKLMRMKGLIEKLIKNNFARYFITVDSQGRNTYATIFTIHKNKGCYLFGAGDRNLMQRYDGTYCIWEGMKSLSESGVYEVDMEGVNSPNRGSFKLSFGGGLKPYYQVYKNK